MAGHINNVDKSDRKKITLEDVREGRICLWLFVTSNPQTLASHSNPTSSPNLHLSFILVLQSFPGRGLLFQGTTNMHGRIYALRMPTSYPLRWCISTAREHENCGRCIYIATDFQRYWEVSPFILFKVTYTNSSELSTSVSLNPMGHQTPVKQAFLLVCRRRPPPTCLQCYSYRFE